jgi:transposase-like protein
MWKRKTFHDCAEELNIVSESFRATYINKFSIDAERRNQQLESLSQSGIEILKILALSIRAEQDFGIISKVNGTVGALKSKSSVSETSTILNFYRPPYNKQSDFEPLELRDALNKIVHANPDESDFYADAYVHDLILCGKKTIIIG